MKNKFIFNGLNIIIEDYNYYVNHSEEIDDWLDNYNSSREGMVIHLADEQTKMLFMLRWS